MKKKWIKLNTFKIIDNFLVNYRNIIEIRYKKNKRYFCFNITTMELSTTVLEKKRYQG
jgi:hypothetical protein